jgi:transcription elongation factor Elf1
MIGNRKLFKFPIVWMCPSCGSYNRSVVTWVGVRDGQGFVEKCIACNKPTEIDLEINTRAYSGGKVDIRI